MATNFTYFTMAPRILLFFGFPQPGGILIFPFTFLLSDVITEVYTYKYANFLIWCVIITLGFFTLGSWVSMLVPAKLDYGYAAIFNHYPRLYASIAIATFISFSANNWIMSKLKTRWNGRLFWWRAILSTAVGHAFFSIIWVLLYHSGEVSFPYLMEMIGCMYLWKMGFEIVGTPFANMISNFLKKKEGFDAYDRDTSYNPFLID
ncbi:MAG: queuosine precursor transporter [Legionellales bacterium]|nr:queuosine precursor transporter [Legionellales bacterium]